MGSGRGQARRAKTTSRGPQVATKGMNHEQILQTFLSFFQERGHISIPSTPLIPARADDPVLFISAGMQPMIPYLEGELHPAGNRVANIQRCLRTTDLDSVGDRTHLTLFQMLGSWSLGDYGLPQSLRWGHELLVDGYGINPDLLHATLYRGDEQCPLDEEALETWADLGLGESQVTQAGEEDNWWSVGDVGLCGPDSEIFYWTGGGVPEGTPLDNPNWVEIWNHVKMLYSRDEQGRLHPLAQRSVDTGMGFERLVSVVQGVNSVYETDLFLPWIQALDEQYRLPEQSSRLAADHLRSSTVLIGEGLHPSNLGRGYVLRRLLRRTYREMRKNNSEHSIEQLPASVIDGALAQFEMGMSAKRTKEVMTEEENKYLSLLKRGQKAVEKQFRAQGLDENGYNYLYETHGLPREVVDEIAATLK